MADDRPRLFGQTLPVPAMRTKHDDEEQSVADLHDPIDPAETRSTQAYPDEVTTLPDTLPETVEQRSTYDSPSHSPRIPNAMSLSSILHPPSQPTTPGPSSMPDVSVLQSVPNTAIPSTEYHNPYFKATNERRPEGWTEPRAPSLSPITPPRQLSPATETRPNAPVAEDTSIIVPTIEELDASTIRKRKRATYTPKPKVKQAALSRSKQAQDLESDDEDHNAVSPQTFNQPDVRSFSPAPVPKGTKARGRNYYENNMFRFSDQGDLVRWMDSIGAMLPFVKHVEFESTWHVVYRPEEAQSISLRCRGLLYTTEIRRLSGLATVDLVVDVNMPYDNNLVPEVRVLCEAHVKDAFDRIFDGYRLLEFNTDTIEMRPRLGSGGNWTIPGYAYFWGGASNNALREPADDVAEDNNAGEASMAPSKRCGKGPAKRSGKQVADASTKETRIATSPKATSKPAAKRGVKQIAGNGASLNNNTAPDEPAIAKPPRRLLRGEPAENYDDPEAMLRSKKKRKRATATASEEVPQSDDGSAEDKQNGDAAKSPAVNKHKAASEEMTQDAQAQVSAEMVQPRETAFEDMMQDLATPTKLHWG